MAKKTTKKKTRATPTPVSPFSTGGGGVRFELLVAVHYLIALLRQEAARGMELGVVQEVRLQQRNRDCPVDDVVVLFRMTGETRRLYLQMKHEITFGKNELLADVVKQAWAQMHAQGFAEGCDAVGVVIGESCNNRTVRRDVADLLAWVRDSSTPRSFYQKVRKFSAKTRVLNAFEEALKPALGRALRQENVYRLLRHFTVLPFDFQPDTGRDSVAATNALLQSVANSDTRNAASLADLLYRMAADYAPTAGDITRETISQRISARASYPVPILQRAGQSITELLAARMKNRLAAEKSSKKYIPDVFVEIGDLKDSARLFCHPVLFAKHLAEDIKRLDLFDLNRHLEMVGLPLLSVQIPLPGSFDGLPSYAKELSKCLTTLDVSLTALERGNSAKLAKRVTPDKVDVLSEVAWRIGDTARTLREYEIRPLQKRVGLVNARGMVIVAKAGQGKTNFVCDLAEHVLLPREIPCAYFTGKELGLVGQHQLEEFVARSVYGTTHTGDISALLADINSEAERRDTTGIILVDAINEHPDLVTFAAEIERFVETCMRFPRLRIILTCRSEFFDERFGNLGTSSFAGRLVIEGDIQHRMTAEYRRRMIAGYLRFFNIQIGRMSDEVRRQFGDDPFLLRMFCEAYGDPDANSARSMSRLRSIRREAMFREYFHRKMTALSDIARRRTGFLAGVGHPYQEVLRTIVAWMVEHDEYADVPISVCVQAGGPALDDVIDEDVLVRRDLAPGSVLGKREVINFTFDACRDFLLADYLLNIVAQEDRIRFRGLVATLTAPGMTVAEGLREYLFFSARYLSEDSLTRVLEEQPWFDETYAAYVFDLEEDAITDGDNARLKDLCLAQHSCTSRIITGLMVRYDQEQNPHANISTLFEVFDVLDNDSFVSLSAQVFGGRTHGVGGGVYDIDRLTNDLRKFLLATGSDWHKAYGTLGRMLLYLWNVPGRDYGYPARDLFSEFKALHPSVAKRLRNEHVAARSKGYQK